MFALIVSVQVKPERREEFLAAIGKDRREAREDELGSRCCGIPAIRTATSSTRHTGMRRRSSGTRGRRTRGAGRMPSPRGSSKHRRPSTAATPPSPPMIESGDGGGVHL